MRVRELTSHIIKSKSLNTAADMYTQYINITVQMSEDWGLINNTTASSGGFLFISYGNAVNPI